MPDKPPAYPYSDACKAAVPPHKADPNGISCATCRATAASRIGVKKRIAHKLAPQHLEQMSVLADEVCDALTMWCHDPASLRDDYLIGLIERRP